MTHDEHDAILATGLHECSTADCPPPVMRTKRRILGLTFADATWIVAGAFAIAVIVSWMLP